METKQRTLGFLSAPSFSVSLDEIEKRDGSISQRIKVDHPEAVAIIVFVNENEILMVRQFRYALNQETWEIPAGKVDPGETPDMTVHRELREETGYQAREIALLHSFYPAIGYSNEVIHLYSARELTRKSLPTDEAEIISCQAFHMSVVQEMIARRELLDAKTLVALLLFMNPPVF